MNLINHMSWLFVFTEASVHAFTGRKVYHRAPPMLHVSVAEVRECLICWHPIPKPEHETEELEVIVVVIEQVAPTVALAGCGDTSWY